MTCFAKSAVKSNEAQSRGESLTPLHRGGKLKRICRPQDMKR